VASGQDVNHGNPAMNTNPCRAVIRGGWILAELLTVLALTAFFSAALVQTAVCLRRCMAHWEESARMRQTLSAALFIVSGDIRLAGSNPRGTADFDPAEFVPGTGGAPERLEIRMDKRGAQVGSRPDGDVEDPDEVVLYRWDDEHEVLRRNNQPLAARIVQNPGGVPVFDLIEQTPFGLVRVFVTTHPHEGRLSLSTAVFMRNPM
jgi:hypothetical protein